MNKELICERGIGPGSEFDSDKSRLPGEEVVTTSVRPMLRNKNPVAGTMIPFIAGVLGFVLKLKVFPGL